MGRGIILRISVLVCAFYLFVPAVFAVGDTDNDADIRHIDLLSRITKGSLALRDFQVKPLLENDESFREVLRMASFGHRKIDIMTFLWSNDSSGRALAHALVQAVKRGVPVRLVIDGLQLLRPWNWELYRWMASEGIEVHFYKPPLKRILSMHYRSHEKAMMTFGPNGEGFLRMGGRNHSDHHLSDDHTVDVDLLMELNASQAQSVYRKQFEEYFKHADIHLFKEDLLYTVGQENRSYDRIRTQAQLDFVYHRNRLGIEKIETQGEGVLVHEAHRWIHVPHGFMVMNRMGSANATYVTRAMLATARQSIFFANAYAIPNESFHAVLEDRLRNGVQVMGYVNSEESTEQWFVVRAMRTVMDPLLEVGARIFLRKKGELHTKVAIADSKFIKVSSVNWDQRSEHYNLENAVFLYSPRFAQEVEDFYAQRLQLGEFSQLEPQHKRSRFQRCVDALVGLGKGQY